MAIEYLGLSEYQRPSASCWRAFKGAAYDEIVEMTVADGNDKEARPYHRDQRG